MPCWSTGLIFLKPFGLRKGYLYSYLFIYLFIFMIIFCHLQVENVVVHFVRQNKRVLVVGSGPVKLNTTRKGGAQTPLGALMDYLIDHEHCGVFCPKGR